MVFPAASALWSSATRFFFALAHAACWWRSAGSFPATASSAPDIRHVKAVLDEHQTLPVLFAPLKFAATALSSIAGIPGGLFSPSLAVGAGIGYDVAQFLPGISTGAIVLLGVVGYFAGVVQAPITAFVIVAEMTADNAMVVPLMATSLIGTLTARLICEEGVYQILARNYLRRYTPEETTLAPDAAIEEAAVSK